MDRFMSALVGSGDSGKGRRSHTSSTREKGLHLFNLSSMAFHCYEETNKVVSSTPIPCRD